MATVFAFVVLLLGIGMTAGFVSASAPDRDPYSLFLVVSDKDGNPVGNASVTIKDLTNGNSINLITNSEGYIGVVLTTTLDAHDGDTIKVIIEKGDLSKTLQFEMNAEDGYKYIEVTVEKGTTDEGRVFGGEFLGISAMNWVIIIIVLSVIAIAGYMYYSKKNAY